MSGYELITLMRYQLNFGKREGRQVEEQEARQHMSDLIRSRSRTRDLISIAAFQATNAASRPFQ